MAAPLSNCTTVEQRAVIRFFCDQKMLKNLSRRFATTADVFLPKGLLLLHDNARPNSGAAKVKAIRLLKFELLSHHMV